MNAGPAATRQPSTDEGLRCVVCDYNLTGLAGERCPECGVQIDWAAVRVERDRRARAGSVPWETWRGWWRVPAFLVTALEVAVLPWQFALRLDARPRLRWAGLFLAICVVWQCGWYLYREPGTGTFPYAIGALTQILLQVLLLSALLPLPHVRYPVRFWAGVSCYTSYPLLVEAFTDGLPVLLIEDWGRERLSNIWPFAQPGMFSPDAGAGVTFMFYLWWFNLVAIAAARLPRRQRWRALLLLLVVPGMVVVSTRAGYHFGEWMDTW